MSTIATELTRLEQAKQDIKAAIIAKGVSVPEDYTLSSYAAAIESIVVGTGGTDTSDATATAFQIAKGFTAYVNAQLISGKLELLTSEDVAISSDGVISLPDCTYIQTGSPISVKIPESPECTTSGNKVTVPIGYIAEAREITVGNIPESYTCTPASTDIQIPADTYLAEPYTIAGDSNLVESSIKSGVSIFGVAGKFTGDATATVDKILSGYTAGVAGQMIEGTMPLSVPVVGESSVTVPAGYLDREQVFDISVGTDTSDATVSAELLPKGVIAYGRGSRFIGTAELVNTASISDNVVTVAAGFLSSPITAEVAEAESPMIDGNVVTLFPGYLKNPEDITIPLATATKTDNSIEITEGYTYGESFIVPITTPTLTDNVFTVTAGYVESTTLEVPEAIIEESGAAVIIGVGYNKTKRSYRIQEELPAVDFIATDLRAGRTAIDMDGSVVVGTMPQVSLEQSGNIISIGEGYSAGDSIEIPKGTVTRTDNQVTISAGFIDDTSVIIPVAERSIANGPSVIIHKGYTEDEYTVTVDIAKDTVVEDNVVHIYKGYNATDYDAVVALSKDAVVEDNVVHIYKGYTEDEHTVTVGDAFAGKTIIPSTEAVTIAEKSFLLGPVTISGEPNLIPANIKEGVSIFNVLGTYAGGSLSPLEKVTATASDVRAGAVFIDSAGALIDGALLTLTAEDLAFDATALTIPKDKITQEMVVAIKDFGLAENTASPEHILKGLTAYNNLGELITGSLDAVSADELSALEEELKTI